MKKSALRLCPVVAAAALAAGLPAAHASVVLIVNTVTGDLQLQGQPGDTLSCYNILTSWGENNFITSSNAQGSANNAWNNDRFGGTPVNASYDTVGNTTFQLETSMSAGNGEWMSMGTGTITTLGNGTQVTYELGEMCAVWGIKDGAGDIRTPMIYNFGTEPATIDLGDHFIPGSPEDLIFGYATYPGFMNTGAFVSPYNPANPSQPASFILTSQNQSFVGSAYINTNYYNDTFSGPGDVGMVVYVPEPASLGLMAVGALALLGRRKRSS